MIMNISTSIKKVVLFEIAKKGTKQVRMEAQKIADHCFVSKASVLKWVSKVEQGKIIIW